MRLPLLLRRPSTIAQPARGAPFGHQIPEPACRRCLDGGRVPHVGDHLAIGMVPCEACGPVPPVESAVQGDISH